MLWAKFLTETPQSLETQATTLPEDNIPHEHPERLQRLVIMNLMMLNTKKILVAVMCSGRSTIIIFRWIAWPSQGQIFVIADQQMGMLNGARTFFQSNTVDGMVDPAVRPVALDLFSFTVSQAHIMQLEESLVGKNYPLVIVNNGDLADRSCAPEYDLALFSSGFFAGGFKRDNTHRMLGIGNHDLTHLGNFTTEQNLRGFFGEILGLPGTEQSYRERYWAPNCGNDAQVLDKKRLIEFMARFYQVDLDQAVTKIAESSDEMFRLNDDTEPRSWHVEGDELPNFKEVYRTFWKDAPDQMQTAIVRKRDRSGDSIHEWFAIMAKKLEDGTHVILLDSMDHTETSPLVPGLSPRFSVAAARIVHAYIAYQNSISDTPQHYVLVSHFPMQEVYNGLLGNKRLWRRGMGKVLDLPEVEWVISSHDHVESSRDLADLLHRKKSLLKRSKALPEDTTGSVTDFPNSTYSLKWEQAEGRRLYQADFVRLESKYTESSPLVDRYVKRHLGELARYRELWQHLPTAAMQRAAGPNGTPGKTWAALSAINRPSVLQKEILIFDTLNLMEFQFTEALTLLDSLLSLMEEEIKTLEEQGDFDASESLSPSFIILSQEWNHLNARYERWQGQMNEPRDFFGRSLSVKEAIQEYNDLYLQNQKSNRPSEEQKALLNQIESYLFKPGTMGVDKRLRKGLNLLELFVSPCGETAYCFQTIQMLLAEIPKNSESWRFMLKIALAAAEEDTWRVPQSRVVGAGE
ncbi:MAG: hypothetical protein H7A33_07590 [Deltaproteobacteria bacterium]|nr:hypothetical protein [Deltaproteobacteria bacterium]